jgi:subtilase family serine protease
MRIQHRFAHRLLLLLASCSLAPLCVSAQANIVPSRITHAVDESRLTVLHGNTHPLARPEFDRGAAPASLPMDRMLLVLKRSPEQEAALEKFMAEQQDPSSPNYHHWLSPQEFGQQFGPADQDIQTITSWLESHGFRVGNVSNGRTVIEFSGTAAQVQEAFHTTIHRYVLPNGEEHWANSSDPAIPAALAPVVVGVHGLHNFFPKPMSHIVGPFSRSVLASQAKARPMFSFPATGPCSAPQQLTSTGATVGDWCFMVAPYDFATIYNVLPLWNASPAIDGTGETIAIVNDSNINLQDVRTFRSLMGLPPKDPQVILATGVDPGIQNNTNNSDESEAVLDAEWTGAVAKNATIDLVIAPSSTNGGTFGGDTAAQFIVDNNLAPILSESFGECEQDLTPSGNNFYKTLWQQAAAEGITVLVSSGDNASAACDIIVVSGPPSQPAQNGLQVNGIASTPYNVAVGGTDFDDVNNPFNYWNSNGNDPTTQASAFGYIPESTWNDSCTNSVFVPTYGSNAEVVCNNSQITTFSSPALVVPAGGSGGASSVYPKPCWQGGPTTTDCKQQVAGITPNDGARDLPDLSLFAGTGTISASSYYFCESDLTKPATQCSLSGQIFGVGGTSVSTQTLAGIMALVNQNANGERQGNANKFFYPLAAQQSPANCNSTNSPAPTCIFNDVTVGTTAPPCVAGSPDCNVTKSGDNTGILFTYASGVPVAPAYNAVTGYDLATGLGSINAANLVNATAPGNPAGWATSSTTPDFTITSTNPTVTISGGSGTMAITISAQNGFNGSLTLSCAAMPAGDTCSFNPPSPVMISGTTSITVTVTKAAALIPPANWPRGWRAPGAEMILLGALLAAILLLSLRICPRRWSTALAVVVMALLIGTIAGCSGSSGTGGGGGGTLSVGTGVVVATNGSITHSMGFTIP